MDYPDLSAAEMICFDVETHDPGLRSRGAGGVRGEGYLVGFSVATSDGAFCEYFPLRHCEGNVESPETALRWLGAQLGRDGQQKIGANVLYDLEWLRATGVRVRGRCRDVQIAEALIDENRTSYSLDSIAQKYLGEAKQYTELVSYSRAHLWPASGMDDKAVGQKARENLRLFPGPVVAPYGRGDVLLPVKIYERQQRELWAQDLWRVFDLETDLLDLLIEMRFRGVRVDLDRVEEAQKAINRRYQEAVKALHHICGFLPNINSGVDLARACDKLGYQYLKTASGRPSFTADFFSSQDKPFFKHLALARKYQRSGDTFIQQKVLDVVHNGRIHPNYWPVRVSIGERDDLRGTRSGRYSTTDPCIHQYPARDEDMAALIRGLFLPEPGCDWLQADHSQQEFRNLIHYACAIGAPGAEDAAARYIDNPDMDFHSLVADLMKRPRPIAKQLNLALSYTMGVAKLAAKLGVSREVAKELFDVYHDGVPFVKHTTEYAERLARERGWVKTIQGRRSHFDLWEPTKWRESAACDSAPLPRDLAKQKYGLSIRRADTRKALNRVVQGTSAEQLKLEMLELWRLGYVPLVSVHDELDFSVNSEKQVREIEEVMVNCVKLKVPNKVDLEIGPDWGHVTKGWRYWR
jgi:DNA polymerase I-like protein with 3'-5' exonuclease and polymerase domains